MTSKEKQKAIDALKTSAPVIAVTQEEFNDYIQTLNKIMDWLEQEPCDDAINREDALMCLTGEIKDTDTIETIIARSVRRIRKLPPVNPQPKTGHWMIDEDSTDRFFATYECSSCKRAIIVPHDVMKAVYKDYPFCHCGAKMVDSQKSEG